MPNSPAVLLGSITLALMSVPLGVRAQTVLGPASPSTPVVRLGTDDGTVAQALPDIDIVSRRLNEARSQIQPSLGATKYDFGRQTIETISQGDNASLNNVLLRAPGVVQDSFGQFHLRDDHANVQYRLDGVQLPEGLSVFGQAFESRFAHSLTLITGSLPAQYGFRTAGVIDIQTKTGLTDPGGEIAMYGGTRGILQPSFSYGGRSGPIDFLVTGDYLHTGIGIENPTSRYYAQHDNSDQFHGLLRVSGILDDTTRISLIAGSSNSAFQIPNSPGQAPGLGLTVNGVGDFNSADLNSRQRENTQFAILSLQKHYEAVDFQLSAFTRYSSLYYSPDPLGELLFNGIAQRAARENFANGFQGDGSWRVSDTHTLRTGFLVQHERTAAKTTSTVLPLDDTGAQTSDQPFDIGSSYGKTGGFYGVYLQDEWKILPTVTVNYGARFDVVDEFTHENQLSPRVNVVWQPTATTTTHIGYSRYFTPPPFEQVGSTTVGQFANTTGAPPGTSNDTVKAERSDHYDAGVSQVVLPGLTVGVDAYLKQSRNLVDEGQFGAPIILTAFNYKKGQVNGVELTGSYERGPWSVYGNLAYSRGIGKQIVSSQFNFGPDELAYINNHFIYLDHDQRWTSSAGVAYTLNADTSHPTRLSADVFTGSGLRASTDTVPNGRGLATYAVANLSAVQKLNVGVGRGTELRFDVLNVTDAKYKIRDGTGVGVGAPQYGLRRAVLAGVSQRF